MKKSDKVLKTSNSKEMADSIVGRKIINTEIEDECQSMFGGVASNIEIHLDDGSVVSGCISNFKIDWSLERQNKLKRKKQKKKPEGEK